jgi:hypothetical protein
MTCPACGNEQSDNWLSCQKCHIIFSRWQPGDAVPGQAGAGSPAVSTGPTKLEPPRAPRPATMYGDIPERLETQARSVATLGVKPQGAWIYLVLLALFAGALWWLLSPRGLAVAPGSYRDLQERFALRPPADWVALTRENLAAITSQYAGQLPESIVQGLKGPGMVVSFVRLSPLAPFSPSVNVVVAEGTMPALNEKSKQEASRALGEGFRSMFADFRMERLDIVEVDKLRSLEMVSTMTFPLRLPGQREVTRFRLRMHQLLVPGGKHAYILTYTDLADAGDDSERTYQQVSRSFRALQRPPRFAPIPQNALLWGLIGGLLALTFSLIRSRGGAMGDSR